jgi:hypothetical protein
MGNNFPLDDFEFFVNGSELNQDPQMDIGV